MSGDVTGVGEMQDLATVPYILARVAGGVERLVLRAGDNVSVQV